MTFRDKLRKILEGDFVDGWGKTIKKKEDAIISEVRGIMGAEHFDCGWGAKFSQEYTKGYNTHRAEMLEKLEEGA